MLFASAKVVVIWLPCASDGCWDGACGTGTRTQRFSDQSLPETHNGFIIGSIMTKSPQSEGCASCCHRRGARTAACPPPLPSLHLFPAGPPWYDAAETGILCFPLCFPSASLGSPPPPPPHRPRARLQPGEPGPRGRFSQNA